MLNFLKSIANNLNHREKNSTKISRIVYNIIQRLEKRLQENLEQVNNIEQLWSDDENNNDNKNANSIIYWTAVESIHSVSAYYCYNYHKLSYS